MAIKALDLGKTTKYVSKEDTGDDPTIWLLGTLSSRDKGAIRDSATSFSFTNDDLARARGESVGDGEDATLDTKIERSRMNFEAVRRGLVGWENFIGPDGNALTFKRVSRDVGNGVKRDVVPNDIMDTIPLAIIDELAEQIMKDVGNEREGKNSPAPSSDGFSTPTVIVADAE